MRQALQNPEQPSDLAPPPDADYIAPAPRVSVQAFCETVATAIVAKAAGEDRRLAKDGGEVRIQIVYALLRAMGGSSKMG